VRDTNNPQHITTIVYLAHFKQIKTINSPDKHDITTKV